MTTGSILLGSSTWTLRQLVTDPGLQQAAMTDGDGLKERVKMLDARPGKVKVFL